MGEEPKSYFLIFLGPDKILEKLDPPRPKMKKNLSSRIWSILVCPYCRSPLSRIDDGAKCPDCHEEYIYSNDGHLDLRLRKKKLSQFQFEIGVNPLLGKDFDFNILQKNTSPQIDFTEIKTPWHLNEALMSYFPKAKRNDSIMLDLGCGSGVHREVCEHAGFEYVGLDYDSPDALILGDAHALPFKNNSFDFILSVAVLEHIRYPFIMMKETYRVLKPRGKFIGTVAFLEPFHGNSFYHHTHLGTFNSLQSAGFDIKYIAPSACWSVLVAQANMSLFPKLPRLISKLLVLPLYLLHRIWWRLGYLITHSNKVSEKCRILHTTGVFFFIANKRAHK